MPSYDGGHYFLTVLIPIGRATCKRDDGTVTTPVNALREALAVLPTARQSPASAASTCVSPFTRSARTHFARFAVLDDVAFNGRLPSDAILGRLSKANPMIYQPVDRLSCPYLIFVADFDAQSGDGSELTSWCQELWTQMEAELRSVFRWCMGFDEVRDAASFTDWLGRCQVETTMPFNDYWTEPPTLARLPLWRLFLPAGLVALIAGAVLIQAGLWLVRRIAGDPLPGWGWLLGAVVVIAALLLALAAAGFVAYRVVARQAAVPFPTAPNSDLPSVLKALHLQHRFTAFAIAAQADDPAALHARFGAFVREHRPAEPTPTQPAGVVP